MSTDLVAHVQNQTGGMIAAKGETTCLPYGHGLEDAERQARVQTQIRRAAGIFNFIPRAGRHVKTHKKDIPVRPEANVEQIVAGLVADY